MPGIEKHLGSSRKSGGFWKSISSSGSSPLSSTQRVRAW